MTTYLESLETPVPLVDLDRLAFNLDRMAAYASLHGLSLRPHVKTHKATRIAAEQLRLGAVGLTCATVNEAIVMSEVCSDILLAYPPVGAARLESMLRIPKSVKLTVAVDDIDSLGALSMAARLSDREIGALVEVDVGMRRVGLADPELAVRIARKLADTPGLSFAGLILYPGHIRQKTDEQEQLLVQLSQNVAQYLEALTVAGLPPNIVSGGSTPIAWRAHEVAGVNEVRPGTYVYNDRTTASIGACQWDDCAMTILATVVSVAVPGQVVVDAGTKALGREPLRSEGSGDAGYGALLDRPEVVVSRMSEEHGILDLANSDWRPRLGDLVRIVPNHVCVAMHLYNEVVGVRGDAVETSWQVSARGRSALSIADERLPARPRAM